jgi:hypothetical protein
MRKLFFGITVVALLLVPMVAGQKTAGQKQKLHAASAARVVRGKYLVEQIGCAATATLRAATRANRSRSSG